MTAMACALFLAFAVIKSSGDEVSKPEQCQTIQSVVASAPKELVVQKLEGDEFKAFIKMVGGENTIEKGTNALAFFTFQSMTLIAEYNKETDCITFTFPQPVPQHVIDELLSKLSDYINQKA